MDAKTQTRAMLVRLLEEADAPLSLGEISSRLGLHFRFVAYLLAQASSAGMVHKLPGGTYASIAGPRPAPCQLEELMQFVLACEAEWRFDDRLVLGVRIGHEGGTGRS
jgi:hypothetical protein